jgi:hypothetical protein
MRSSKRASIERYASTFSGTQGGADVSGGKKAAYEPTLSGLRAADMRCLASRFGEHWCWIVITVKMTRTQHRNQRKSKANVVFLVVGSARVTSIGRQIPALTASSAP